MKPRRTFNIDKIIEIVNRRNLLSTCDPKVREGWNSLLGEILHQANRYNGYHYYSDKTLSQELIPGVRTDDNGIPLEDYEERFENTDETRRRYFS